MLLVTYLLGVQDHLGRDLELLTLLTRNVPEVIFGPRMEVFSWFLMERKYSQIAYRTIIFALDPADHEDKFVYILRALSRIDDDGNLALATYQAMYEFDGPLLVTLLASDKFHIETRACEHLYQVGCRDARLESTLHASTCNSRATRRGESIISSNMLEKPILATRHRWQTPRYRQVLHRYQSHCQR